MSLKQKTILVVDDDEDMVKLLTKILAAAGFTVQATTTPEKGREILEKEAPHVILTDLQMAPESGFQFIQSVRNQAKYSTIPVLVLSSLNDFNSVKKVIALGINDYCIKPLQPPVLIRKLKKALLNKDFIKWDAPLDEQVEVTVELPIEVSALGETGYTLKGPFRVADNKEVRVEVPEFREMGLHIFPQRSTAIHKAFQFGGSFLNDVTFIGINDNAGSKIRKFVMQRDVR